MERRNFLKNISLASVGTTIGAYRLNAINPSPMLAALANAYTETDHVLVIIQMSGGNDGLNMIVGLDQMSGYTAARANIALPESKILKLNDKTGIHPAMADIRNMFTEGKVNIVQSVGYPSPNFSHFRATDIWMSASESNQVITSGWAGRYLDSEYPNFPNGYPNKTMPDPLAIQIGSSISLTLQGASAQMGMTISNLTTFYNFLNGKTDPAPASRAGKELTFIRTVEQQTQKYNDVIKTAANKVTSQYASYPTNNRLADQLKIVARLIAGGLKTRIYMVSTGGFDTHSAQTNTDTTTGTHANLLKGVNDAIKAFTEDLKFLKIEDKVMGMTFSEFGRRIKSNGSVGTDHGAAAPLFVFGKATQGGVLGNSPVIATNVSANANVPMQYDFRSVYASLLQDWFCVSGSTLDQVMLKNFQTLPLIKSGSGCLSTATHEENQAAGKNLITNYPNPFTETTTVEFETFGGHTMIQVFNVEGRLIQTLVDTNMPEGKHQVQFEGYGLSHGVYYARLQNQSVQQVRTMLKVR